MWREILCSELSVGAHTKIFTLGQLAEELINILPVSPDAFKYTLVSQFDERKKIDKNDLHKMICYISETLGEETLAQYLSVDSRNGQIIEFGDEWVLSDSTCNLCREEELFLDVYVNRHKVADLSETGQVDKFFSLKSLEEGTGIFISHYYYKHYTLILRTDRKTQTLSIDVVRS